MLIISVYAGSCEASFDEAVPQEVSTPTLSVYFEPTVGLQAQEHRLRLKRPTPCVYARVRL
jgi:hypothetical protein